MSTAKQSLWLSITIAIFVLSGCFGIYPAMPTPVPVTFDDVGIACFTPHGSSGLRIWAGAERADLCWSSSCTVMLEQSHQFTIDQESRIIHLTWHVVAIQETMRDGVPIACSADCSGPGKWLLETEDLRDGEYVVKIGDKIVGTLNIPLVPDPLQSTPCFRTGTPEDSPSSPLPTPIAHECLVWTLDAQILCRDS